MNPKCPDLTFIALTWLPIFCFAVVSYNQEEFKAMQCFDKEPDII